LIVSATEESNMAVEIEGVHYVSAAELAREVGVSRQTLWRWRKEGKIPSGHRFRDRQVMFTKSEVEAIREHANRIEPIANSATNGQLELFDAR
jgi:predicted DNA-binding transcriptional regulator AlpA